MEDFNGFVAYPSKPREVGEAIRAAHGRLKDKHGHHGLSIWEENDVAGRCLVDPILSKIALGNILIADITRLNFNVLYEVGFAIGKKKRVFLIKNNTLTSDEHLIQEVGIFDTLGYQEYQNSQQLIDKILKIDDLIPLKFDEQDINTKQPVYVVTPQQKTNLEVRLISRIKKAKLQFRTFDPEEQTRLSAREAIENVARSHGVIIPLRSKSHVGADIHNFRAAFVAGLAHGMEKLLLLLQCKNDPIPLDYRDSVSSYTFPEDIDNYIGEFASDVTERLQSTVSPIVSEPKTFLAKLNLGASSAENEMRDLGNYYLETDEYQRTLRGEVQIVAGRKGAGKTALFVQVRDKHRQNKQLIVLDLKPEGFQLVKFKELVLDLLEEGTKEHTLTAFWEYLLLLETCQKILDKDKTNHQRDQKLYRQYRTLADTYQKDDFVAEGDFAERMTKLIHRISEDFQSALAGDQKGRRLSSAELTELLYKHDVAKLRQHVGEYLKHKAGLWIFFDNLDKGWPSHGLGSDDLVILRCLIDSLTKIERWVRREGVESHGVIFIRNDVYELLIENTPDRGKVSRVILDWTDSDLLRELLRKRFVYNGLSSEAQFEQVWRQLCASHIDGEESSQYLIDRCLMRPRSLIDLLQDCRNHAVNLGHEKIDVEDIKQGEERYSSNLVTDIGFELRDVFPDAEDILYEFIESPAYVPDNHIKDILVKKGFTEEQQGKILDLLLWYGILGFVRDDGDIAYIYSVKYDMKRLKALINHKSKGKVVYHINPAFWRGLEIKPEHKDKDKTDIL